MNPNRSTQLLPWMKQFIQSIPHLESNSRKAYLRILLSFDHYLGKLPGKENRFTMISEALLLNWLKEMNGRHCLHTVAFWAGTVDRFLSFLKEEGRIEENPLAQLLKRYPSKGWKGIIQALWGASPEDSLKSLKLTPRFISPLGPSMVRYIALHRSQGKAYVSETSILERFDRFLLSYSDPPPTELSTPIFTRWLELFAKSKPKHRYKNFMVIRGFCLYLRRLHPEAYLPEPLLTPTSKGTFLPYIFSLSEIHALLKAAHQLKTSAYSPLRPQTFYIVILLLYTTGIRLGEALRLRLQDIDHKDQSLYIHQTKFYKTRLVPLSQSMMKELEGYLKLRKYSGAPMQPESFVFQNPHQKGHYSNSAIEIPFRQILKRLGLKPTPGHHGPRIHDLRHSFSVHRLEQWYQKGYEVQSRLAVLSTYLGHRGVASTQRYLTMTTELLQQASQRFDQHFFSNPIPKGEPK